MRWVPILAVLLVAVPAAAAGALPIEGTTADGLRSMPRPGPPPRGPPGDRRAPPEAGPPGQIRQPSLAGPGAPTATGVSPDLGSTAVVDRVPAPDADTPTRHTGVRPTARTEDAPDRPRMPDRSLGPAGPAFRATLLVAGGALLVAGALLARRTADPLDHPVRRRVLRAIRARPASPVARIAARLDLDESTVRHHVAVLEEADLVTSIRQGRARLLHGRGDDVDPRLARLVAHRLRRRILDRLARTTWLRQDRLRRDLDVAASTLSHHLSRLREAGLIRSEPRGRTRRLRLVDERRAHVLDHLRSSSPGSG